LPDGFTLDGEERTDVLLGKPAPRTKPLFWEYGRNDRSFAYAKGRDKSPNVALRDGSWKLLIQADGSGAELYNVVTDRAEAKNVAADHAAIVKQMSQRALDWRKSLPSPKP
jgi:hypothetical protein